MRLVHLSITIALSVLHAAVLAPMLAAHQSPVASGINLAIFIFITSALLMQAYWLIKSEINQMIDPLLDREEERALKAIIDRAALASSTQHMRTALTYSMGANKITTNPAGTSVVNSISIKDLIKHAEVTLTRQCERKTVLVTDNMDLTGLRARLWEKLTEQALPPELMALPPGAEKVFAADLAKPEGDPLRKALNLCIRIIHGGRGVKEIAWNLHRDIELALLAAPAAQGDAKDADRYRWLRDGSLNQWQHPLVVSQERYGDHMHYLGPLTGSSLDSSVDAAIAASKAGT